jgi:hypothetical protein
MLFGKDHLNTLISLINLGGIYFDKGEYERALLLNEIRLAKLQRDLGEDHPNTLISLCNLTSVLGKKKSAKNASVSARQLDFSSSHNNHADIFYAMGKYGRALPLYVACVDRWRSALGEDPPLHTK